MKSNLHFTLLTTLLLLPMVAVPANDETPEDKSGDTAQRFAREESEWVNVSIPDANTNKVPRVLFMGDSITRGYYPGVEKELKPIASCAEFTTSSRLMASNRGFAPTAGPKRCRELFWEPQIVVDALGSFMDYKLAKRFHSQCLPPQHS
jgi:hypothetical protein